MNYVRKITITSNHFEKICKICGEKIHSNDVIYRNALTGNNPRQELLLLAGKCKITNDDSFTSNLHCEVNKMIDFIARTQLLVSPPHNVDRYHDASAETFLSALIRDRNLQDNESDLTGDAGKLALNILIQKYDFSQFGCVVDIGGQDSGFVRNFPKARQVIIDKNTLCVFLDKMKDVRYAIGEVEEIFKDLTYLSEDVRPKTLFSMNNFINVLSPESAWKVIKMTTDRMNEADTLVITSIDEDHFKMRFGYYENIGNSKNGIIEFNRKSTKKHYKSTIGPEFVNFLRNKIPQLELEIESTNKLQCIIKGNKKIEVKFRTVLLTKSSDRDRFQ